MIPLAISEGTHVSFEIREIIGFADVIQANEALGREHYEEIALNKAVMAYAPDVDRYARLEQLGVLLTLGVFKGDVLVGYSVNIITPHLHYRDLLTCHNDMIYIAPAHRRGTLGVKLIKATRDAVKAKGVQLMLWHAKENTPLAKLLPRLGCGVQDILFSEVL